MAGEAFEVFHVEEDENFLPVGTHECTAMKTEWQVAIPDHLRSSIVREENIL